MRLRPRTLLVLGPPGSGKDTQTEALSRRYGYYVLETGDLFRSASDQNTPFGRRIRSIIRRGDLVPAALVNDLIDQEIARHLPTIEEKGLLLNGYPRLAEEVTHLEVLLDRFRLRPLLALFLSVEEEELVGRLTTRARREGREDDTPEVIRHRLRVFREETAPILDFYRKRGELVEIDGNPPIEEVTRAVVAAVETWHP